MRTKDKLKYLVMGALVLTAGRLAGQASVLGNNGITTNFLGWDANPANNFPLQVRHDGSWPIDFWTSQSFRARINPRMTYPSLNSFTNIPADGFTLITPDNGFLGQAPRGPFSRLHLAERGTTGNAEQWGYRPWQRNGITFTGNTDQAYLGQKYSGDDNTDFVIQWSDKQRLRQPRSVGGNFTALDRGGIIDLRC